MEKNFITPLGLQKLKQEYQFLKHEERPKVVDVVAWAAGNGDRSENGDYIYGKKRLREIDRRIRYLLKQIDNAEVIDPVSIRSEKVQFGATVKVIDWEGKERVFRLVGVDEIEPKEGKISWCSPIGLALNNAESGDYVSYQSPAGERDLEILSVSYEVIA